MGYKINDSLVINTMKCGISIVITFANTRATNHDSFECKFDFVTIVTLTPYLRKTTNETSITKIDTKRREDRNASRKYSD